MRAVIRVACLCCVLVTIPLEAQAPSGRTWSLADAPPELADAVSRATLITLTLQDALLHELTSALAQGGPDMAVNSCHIDVIAATRRVNRQRGVEAGRTSHRLRNPINAPRAWAAPLVEANAGRMARDVEGFVVDLDSKVGVLRSIAHGPVCASCHGPAEELSTGVRAALGARYPTDRATGFRAGEIRGWFWVELPKKAHR